MRTRKKRILQKWKTKSLVAEPGLRLDSVDPATILYYCDKMEKLKIAIMRLQVAEMKC